MTEEEFLGRIDEIMCGTSNAERAYLSDMYMNMMDDFENKLKEWVKNDGEWFIISKNGEPCINEVVVDSIMHKLRYDI